MEQDDASPFVFLDERLGATLRVFATAEWAYTNVHPNPTLLILKFVIESLSFIDF